MLIFRAQYNFADIFDEKAIGWAGHTRVRLVKKPGGITHAYYVSGVPLEKIKYVEIVKTIGR